MWELNRVSESEFKNQEKFPLIIILDDIRSLNNIGSFFRTADAFNIDGIILRDGCVDPYNPKVVRATMGSIFRIPLYFVDNGVGEIEKLKQKGMRVYSSSLEDSLDIREVDFSGKSIVVIGNESNGVSREIYDISDSLIKIPMPGGSESLNAGVAASIIMYEAMKQKD